MKRISIIVLLGVLAIVGIAATVNKTPILRGFLQSNLDGNGYAITNVLIDSASYSTNAEFVLTSTLTNQIYASNVVSGGVIPLGAVATNTGWNGSVLVWSNSSRVWSQDGSALTNVPFSIFTNYALAPTEYTNVGALAFGTNLYGMTSFWTFASVPIIGTVPIFNFGIDTNTVITTNGGTFTGTILDNSVSSTAPANNQLVTANWVRGLFAGAGVSYYSTTNINNTFTNADIVTTNTAVYELSTNIPVYSRRVYTAPTNNSYMGQVVTTNTFQQLLSGVTVNAYLEAQNGSGTGGPQVKPEIYVSYDRTNWIGDWDASPQYIPEGATNLYSWVVSNPTYVSTNAGGFYVQRRFKMVTQTSPTASDVLFHLGTNRPSHITLSAADSYSGNAFLAANQAFTGSNTFSGGTMTWGDANKTNGVYIGPVGEVLSNALGSVTISGGNVTASGLLKGTNGYASAPLTVATLPASPVLGQTVWASDVLTSRGTGDYCYYDGTNWRTREHVVATSDLTNFVLNAWTSSLRANSPVSKIGTFDDGPYVNTSGNIFSGIFGYLASSSAGVSFSNPNANGQLPYLETTTSASGRMNVIWELIQAPDASSLAAVGCISSVGNAADGTETYWAVIGLHPGLSSYPTSGSFFLYDRYNINGHGLATTNNWICVVAQSSSYTYQDSGLPVTVSGTPADQLMVILTSGAASFYTNKVACYINTGPNLPTGSTQAAMGIYKTAGTTTRKLYIQALYLHSRHATRNH